MARTSICNVRVENTALQEHIEVLSRAYGYVAQIPATVDGESVLVPNPETMADFVQRSIREKVAHDYATQYAAEHPPTINYQGD